jgi:hypothetical protein
MTVRSYPETAAARLALPQVTVCAVTSVNVKATLRALEACLDAVDFAACKLFTDAASPLARSDIAVVPIGRLESSAAYSQFLLAELVDHVATSHCLVVQWDGHVLDARRWRPEFLEYDYIGASWPQFDDGHDVGNGGFSLRSRRLMQACREPGFCSGHPEDTTIARTNRDWLERRGMRFAPRELADLFAAERAGDPGASFGYHGVFNMPGAIGVDAFWDVYRGLDDRGTVRRDFKRILRDVGRAPGRWVRTVRMIADHMGHALREGRMR